jgi:hypothetical protein
MANRRLPDPPSPADSASKTETAATRPAARPRKLPGEKAVTVVRVTPEARRALIAETAYLRAEQRGFAPGHETEDWLAAEAEVDALLKVERSSPQ